MGYATYHNGELTLFRGRVLGFFRLKAKEYFEYAERTPADNPNFAPAYKFVVFLKNGYRYAHIMKTRAHVIVDEDENGNPIVENWKLKNHKTYS